MRSKTFLAIPIVLLASGLLVTGAQQEVQQEAGEEVQEQEANQTPIAYGDCSFLQAPEHYVPDMDSLHTLRSRTTAQVSTFVYAFTAAGDAIDASAIPRKNFIDEAIFGRMEADGIQSAPLATDGEFLRRVTLDLTGRIATSADIDAFLADPNPAKRDIKIDQLIGSPEFIDKWTMFFGDLFKVNAQASNVNRQVQGRDAFYLYIRDSIAANKPYDLMARELIAAEGDNFENGPANWPVGNTVPMGPAQDTYDGHAVNTATMFLGINAVDCLLCHDGARHLDQVNLWGSTQTRQNMWGLSAYFARTRMQRQVVDGGVNLFKTIVTELPLGEYRLNTTTGNRSARQPINGVSIIAPRNPFTTTNPFAADGGGILPGENRRQALARQVTGDIQFSRAAVNYIWEKFMVEAFVSPSNSFDPARLDPGKPLPAGWTLQPTNAALLNSLAAWFQQSGYNVRALMALITKSSAYQLSSVYPGTWKVEYVPYYARKYVRRLDAEEIHDAVTAATAIIPTYLIRGGALPPVNWAMQFPDTREAGNAVAATFLNSFDRGNRDTLIRRSDGSLAQALSLMNSPFVMQRIHQNNPGSRVAGLLSLNLNPEAIVAQMFQHTLARRVTAEELALYTPLFQQLGTRAATESLQWLLMNKLEFIFNY